MRTSTRSRTRLSRRLAWLAVAGLTTAALLAPAGAARAASVEPKFIGDQYGPNPKCDDLDGPFGGGQTWVPLIDFDWPIPDDGDGIHTVNGVTVTNFSGQSFDWSSTIGVDAVLVKAGSDNHALYVYAPTPNSPESFGDTNLTKGPNQQGISHLLFCKDISNPEPTATPTEEPTATPTDEPTATPTEEPTATPTEEATATPTGEVEPTTTPNTEPTPTGEVEPATGKPRVTLPPTDTIGETPAAPTGEGWRMVILAFAGILAAALLLTPASAVIRKDDDRK